MRSIYMKRIKIVIFPIIAAGIILIVLRTILFVGYVPSTSMEPTLYKDSIIIGIRKYRRLEKRDIVIFRHEGKLLVKRIVGVAGERIRLYNRIYFVPEDSYLMLGDNLTDSYDSRYWDNPYIMKSDILAKVIQ